MCVCVCVYPDGVQVPFVRKLFWKKWYNFISDNQATAEVSFMNYGYDAVGDEAFNFEGMSWSHWEANRYSAQLYFFTGTAAGNVELGGKTVLEVGCGRGGGCRCVRA